MSNSSLGTGIWVKGPSVSGSATAPPVPPPNNSRVTHFMGVRVTDNGFTRVIAPP